MLETVIISTDSQGNSSKMEKKESSRSRKGSSDEESDFDSSDSESLTSTESDDWSGSGYTPSRRSAAKGNKATPKKKSSQGPS